MCCLDGLHQGMVYCKTRKFPADEISNFLWVIQILWSFMLQNMECLYNISWKFLVLQYLTFPYAHQGRRLILSLQNQIQQIMLSLMNNNFFTYSICTHCNGVFPFMSQWINKKRPKESIWMKYININVFSLT